MEALPQPQVPPVHVWPEAVQLTQSAPPEPHCVFAVPE